MEKVKCLACKTDFQPPMPGIYFCSWCKRDIMISTKTKIMSEPDYHNIRTHQLAIISKLKMENKLFLN